MYWISEEVQVARPNRRKLCFVSIHSENRWFNVALFFPNFLKNSYFSQLILLIQPCHISGWLFHRFYCVFAGQRSSNLRVLQPSKIAFKEHKEQTFAFSDPKWKCLKSVYVLILWLVLQARSHKPIHGMILSSSPAHVILTKSEQQQTSWYPNKGSSGF